MSKRTWKKRAISPERIRAALNRAGGSVTRAAAALGVNRSTLHRWLQADPSLRPRSPRENVAPSDLATPEAFGAWVLATFEPTPAERQLLELALEALEMARDPGRNDGARLAATREFRMILRDLNLEAPDEAQAHGATS